MPELPDVEVYVECLKPRVVGQTLRRIRVASPFLVRSVDPPLREAHERSVRDVRRLGKRIVLALDDDLFLVLHLMIAGRLRWRGAGAKLARKVGLCAFDFQDATLVLTEASPKKRASLHLVRGGAALATHDPGGADPLTIGSRAFRTALERGNHTLKRALTDPRLFSGIGNAYSDEILHRAGLSPMRRATQLKDDERKRLHRAVRDTLREWTARLRAEVGDGFPEKVTAFREGMAVHGRYGKPCPACNAPVQRIVYAENEANYCAKCQTGGRLLADRSLSRLLHDDWPRTIEELEARK
jgi:formamidopyrimidine-DNA glycosylase